MDPPDVKTMFFKNRPFFTADILTCHSKKSTGVNDII